MSGRSRSVTCAEGIVAASHPLAVDAGIGALRQGGSAADAAVAAAAVLTVVDARSTGIGGDLFAMYWQPGESRPRGLAAAGVAPGALDLGLLRNRGLHHMPQAGPLSITVPGAPAGWDSLLDLYGRLPRQAIVESAIRIAREGHEVSPVVAREWSLGIDKLAANEASSRLFLVDGRPPQAGDHWVIPQMADALSVYADEGSDPFYRGRIATDIAAAVHAAGGVLTERDLEEWAGPRWVDPMTVRYRGVDVYEMPPPGQGAVVLQALKIFEGFADDLRPEQQWHALIESVKLAFTDVTDWLGDPSESTAAAEAALEPAYVDRIRETFDPTKAAPADLGRESDTVYIAVATPSRGACSLIQSVYESFGSGVSVAPWGIALQNRASGFNTVAGHVNCVGPRRTPYHTIIPAMLGRGPDFAGALGIVGGYMQPQGQVQLLHHILDHGMDPQAALDAPRFRAYRGRRLGLEPGFTPGIRRHLEDLGHELEDLPIKEAGGGQVVLRSGSTYIGGSDRRKDGRAAAVAQEVEVSPRSEEGTD
jgi:gamma-glutamyltranspeptidase / glutathione hydrolase